MTYEELYAAVSELRSQAGHFFEQPTEKDLKRFDSDIEKILNYLEKINKAQLPFPLDKKDKDEKENIAESDLIIKQIEEYIKSTATLASPASALAETITNKPPISPLSSTFFLGNITSLNTDTEPTKKSSNPTFKRKTLVRTANYQFSCGSYKVDPPVGNPLNQLPPHKKARVSPLTEPPLFNLNTLIPRPNRDQGDNFVQPSISASNLQFLRRIKPYIDKALTEPKTTSPTSKT